MKRYMCPFAFHSMLCKENFVVPVRVYLSVSCMSLSPS